MVNNMYEKLDTALKLINDEVPEDGLYNKTIATPTQIVLPEAWLLVQAVIAPFKQDVRGVGYSFAQFFNGEMTKEILELYKRNFINHQHL